MTRVVGASSSDLPDAAALLDLHYEIVNVDTGITTQEIQAYRDKGLGVNVYTIDEPWLFSQYWLSGVTSVTTNNVQSFSPLQKPYLNLSYSRYLLFWGVYGIILAIWLASSQPGPEREPETPAETRRILMDFALEDEKLEAMDAEPVTPEPEPEAEAEAEVVEPSVDDRLKIRLWKMTPCVKIFWKLILRAKLMQMLENGDQRKTKKTMKRNPEQLGNSSVTR